MHFPQVLIMEEGRLFPVNVSCQSVDVSPESRTVLEQAVEPVEVMADHTHGPSYVVHGKQRTHSDDMPLPFSEEEVAEDDPEQYERNIDRNLDLGKFNARHLAEGYGETFSGHGYASASHLEGDACRQDGASGQLGYGLFLCRQGVQPGEEIQVQVDQHTEYETHEQLEQLYRIKLPAEYAYLSYHQQGIHQEGIQPDGQWRGESVCSRVVKDVRQYTDDAGSQHAFHAEGDAQCHDAEGNKKQRMLPCE